MRILLADDHSLVREGLLHVLEELAPAPEVVQACDYPGALEAAARYPELDLALLDLHMPGMDGFAGLAAFRRRFPLVPLVVLSGAESPDDVRAAFRAGASGYIPKSSTAQVMLNALKLVLAGGVFLPNVLLDAQDLRATSLERTAGRESASTRGLTERQLQVLALLAEGKPNKVIARALDITEGTVKIHLAAIFQTLSVRNRTEAVIAAREMDLARYRVGS